LTGEAAEEVEDPEDEHLYHSKGWCCRPSWAAMPLHRAAIYSAQNCACMRTANIDTGPRSVLKAGLMTYW
jgi:hypothetical protein